MSQHIAKQRLRYENILESKHGERYLDSQIQMPNYAFKEKDEKPH